MKTLPGEVVRPSADSEPLHAPVYVSLGLCFLEEERGHRGHHHLRPPLQPGAQQPALRAPSLCHELYAGRGELLV